jgi:hypothetical protein
LGTSVTHDSQSAQAYRINFDCWKPLLHVDSPEPSNGKRLGDIFADGRIKEVQINGSGGFPFPELILCNIWDEKFLIQYVNLPNDTISAHAVLLN